ncbi:DNA polymerase/3'-5' exonuclease PolX [Candidatus Woesearchaeota archaeon]|nr:DNA polymerase/3'-5' exonuclease PolX [Candidatus Woesearchaeota archaeon]HIH38512.1 DNA polymerase/3'-5' exonuclease PolX [Candidatus Woesearchaeota archaeon]HIH48221.1 DNA polymerase/3'-5' exonuclease PolX [Candidatus Woesearchaeota archaeon]HIJ04470.1 DNA polymerase/3'-5' exonuclease PolX [Candidatus Woesearchaeota archaeon]
MKNQEVADLLREIAEYLEITDVPFKPRAYQRAALVIETLAEPIEDIWKAGKLEDIPSVGEGIAKKIAEYLEKGKSAYLKKLKKELPIDADALLSVGGLGPKKVKILYKTLNIKNIEDLKKAAEQKKIRNIEGFGEKTENTILEGITFLQKTENRISLGFALPLAESLKDQLLASKRVHTAEIAGSLRRSKETIGDIDLLAASDNPKRAVEAFLTIAAPKALLGKGEKKCSVILTSGMQVDLRIVKREEFGAALQYFTGSKSHNIALRNKAIKKGYKLNEYGLFKRNKRIAGGTEDSIYKKLGMAFIPPEMRENLGEIQLAEKGSIPPLVKLKDIKGDFHTHTIYSDGRASIEEMIKKAESLGYSFIGISDHFGHLRIANAMDEQRIKKQWKEINAVQKKHPKIKIVKGAEVNINKDGSLDIPPAVLRSLDYAIISVHTNFKMGKQEMTKRICDAMEHENILVLGHPTGGMIGERKPYEVDFDEVVLAAKQHNIALEINSQSKRMDLASPLAKAAIEQGCRVSINTDAHYPDSLEFMRFGVGIARRAWAGKADIINAKELKQKS